MQYTALLYNKSDFLHTMRCFYTITENSLKHQIIQVHANSIKLRTTGTSTPACPDNTPTAAAAAAASGAGGVGQTQLQQLRPPTRRKKTRPRKPRCLKVTMENFSTFCQQTSLHGWQYIAQKQTSNMKHVFWAIIVSLSMGTAALFLYNNTMDYLHATVSLVRYKRVILRP